MTQRLDQEIFGPEADRGDEQSPRPKRRTGQSMAALLLSVGVLAGGGYAAYHVAEPVLSQLVTTDDYPGPGSGSVEVTIESGEGGNAIAAKLVRAGVIKTAKAWRSAAASNPRAEKIQPGTYSLHKEMKASDVIVALDNPENRSVLRITVREGLWASEVYELLSSKSKIPIKDYQAAAKDTAKLGLPEVADGNVEGWLFPATYDFDPKSTAQEQLKTMVEQAVKVMTEEKIPKADWQRTMILASIIESEAGSDSDRPKVARVFLNRLEQPQAETVGLLQSDATVSYGAKRRAVAPTPEELADKSNPYNTRVHKGLPPGPISNPGKASLDAASHPADGNWLYFVTVNPDTGETKFSDTYAQFLEDSKEFRQWCADNPDAKC